MQMQRYFIEVAYKGTAYGGFQVQQNADTIQGRIENVFKVFFRQNIELTGSSRTDAGVHARQNFFHTDTDLFAAMPLQKIVYHVNAILPPDIVVTNIFPVSNEAHCRFDALSRYYIYSISTSKDPFAQETAFFFPIKLNKELLNECAAMLLRYEDYTCFSKKHTQAKTTICKMVFAEWKESENLLEFHVCANRFLRGMVKALTGTMLQVALQKLELAKFEEILKSHNCSGVDFSVPSHGLCLAKVNMPENLHC